MTGTPAVSICIPSYNYAAFLPQALDSALGQSARDLEVLVVDNCSDDGSMEILERYARRDPRVVVHRNEANVGMMGNFNRCIELARGRYVKFLCADDTLEPACVERLAAAMEASPGVRLAACARRYFGGARERVLAYSAGDRVTAGPTVIRDCFYKGNLIGEPTAVISAHRAPDAPGGGELRLSLSSPFEPRDAEGFRCPLYPLDRAGDVVAMLVDLLRDCRVTDIRTLAGVHADRTDGTGLPLLFKPESIPAAATFRIH